MGLTDHVAIALDFSPPSQVAAEAGFELAALTGAQRLTVLHATRDVVLPAGEAAELRTRLEDLRDRIVKAADEQLEALCQRLSGPSCERLIVSGRPSAVIPKALRAHGVTLLVLGTHARKGLRRVFAGSIAEDLLRGLEIPALVTLAGGDGVSPAAELEALRHVVVGVDVTDQAERLVEAVVSLFARVAATRPLTVHLVHATGGAEELEAIIRDQTDTLKTEARQVVKELHDSEAERAEALMDRLEPILSGAGFGVVRHTVAGDFVDEAMRLVEALPAQVVVVGSHGRHGAPLLELGSTAARTIRASDVSVLVVPSHEPESDAQPVPR